MKIFKNVLISVLIGHIVGLIACMIGTFFALKMPNSDVSSAIFGIISSGVGVLAMAIASKRQSSGSIVCALSCGALYSALSFGAGALLFEKDVFGWMQLVMLAVSFVLPLLMCFSGVTFMGKRRKTRRIKQKIYK